MSQTPFSRYLVDTRAFPTDPVKNDLLLYASQIVAQQSNAQTTLAKESLDANVYQMLKQNHYLGLSVAMAMSANSNIYRALWESLERTLMAKTETEIQWFAIPVVLVVGSNQDIQLDNQVPVDHLLSTAEKFNHLQDWKHLNFHSTLLDAESFTAIKADKWFQAKQNMDAAKEFLASLPTPTIHAEAGQEVQVVYAIAYSSSEYAHLANQSLQDAALHLMQVWQEHFTVENATIFTNPLALSTPLSTLISGSQMRLRMACDVFTTNAIRAIRLQSPRVGVVIASQEGGQLLFGFNATEGAFEVQPMVFEWHLDFMENIDLVLQNFIELLAECQVENIRILHEPLKEQDTLPTYAQARNLPSINPLFAEMQ